MAISGGPTFVRMALIPTRLTVKPMAISGVSIIEAVHITSSSGAGITIPGSAVSWWDIPILSTVTMPA